MVMEDAVPGCTNANKRVDVEKLGFYLRDGGWGWGDGDDLNALNLEL